MVEASNETHAIIILIFISSQSFEMLDSFFSRGYDELDTALM